MSMKSHRGIDTRGAGGYMGALPFCCLGADCYVLWPTCTSVNAGCDKLGAGNFVSCDQEDSGAAGGSY